MKRKKYVLRNTVKNIVMADKENAIKCQQKRSKIHLICLPI